MLPAVEDVCRAHGSAAARAAAASGGAASVPPRALVLKHCLRDEYDDLTDIARLYRIKARFAGLHCCLYPLDACLDGTFS